MKSIHRWASMTVAILAAAAFVLPTMAGAAQITNSGGGILPVNSIIKAESSNVEFQTETLGAMRCTSFGVEANLTKNSGGVVEAAGLGTGTTKTCTRGSDSISFSAVYLLHFNATSPSSGEVTLKFSNVWPGPVVCTFEGSAAVTYAAGSSSIHLNGDETLDGKGCGVWSISGDFKLTSGGAPVALL